jgi:hypothetical protein
MKLNTQQIKQIICDKLLHEPEVTEYLAERHGGTIPSDYFNPKRWARNSKFIAKDIEAIQDRLGSFDPLEDD